MHGSRPVRRASAASAVRTAAGGEVSRITSRYSRAMNVFRDPTLFMQQLVTEELARRGFSDLRPALLAVGRRIGAEGSRITELAERAWLTKPTVVHAVGELERLGYVTRQPDPSDGRAKLVVPTDRAREVERAVREFAIEIRGAWAGLIGEDEMAALESGLRRLRAALWPEANQR